MSTVQIFVISNKRKSSQTGQEGYLALAALASRLFRYGRLKTVTRKLSRLRIMQPSLTGFLFFKLRSCKMTDRPQDIIAAYAERKINKVQFKNRFAEWQKKQDLDYSCKGTADKQGVYLTYRNITATIKNGILHFKTYTNDTANTLFEFCRKVDFYREGKDRELSRAMAMANFYQKRAREALENSDMVSYYSNMGRVKEWAIIIEAFGGICL